MMTILPRVGGILAVQVCQSFLQRVRVSLGSALVVRRRQARVQPGVHFFNRVRARSALTPTPTQRPALSRERERKNLPLLFVFRACFVVQKLEILKRR
jgi:hypothetical protein